MSNTNTGGPAFPPSNPGYAHGMTLRDYFAAKALVGIIAHPEGPAGLWDKCALQAYEVADAMIRAREAT